MFRLFRNKENLLEGLLTENQAFVLLALNKATPKENIATAVDVLDERSELLFFDWYYPQISDPGAFVTVWKRGNTFSAKFGNHGWSTNSKKISREKVIETIYNNRDHNGGKMKLQARYAKTSVFNPKESKNFYFDISDLVNKCKMLRIIDEQIS